MGSKYKPEVEFGSPPFQLLPPPMVAPSGNSGFSQRGFHHVRELFGDLVSVEGPVRLVMPCGGQASPRKARACKQYRIKPRFAISTAADSYSI